MPRHTESYVREPLPQGVRFVLPRRTNQGVSGCGCFGVLMILFGIAFAAFPVWAISQADEPVMMLFTIPFVMAGLATVVAGSWAVAGHGEVSVTTAEVVAGERVGPFVWRRRRPAASVRRVFVEEEEVKVNDRPVRGIGSLKLELEIGKPFVCVFLYRNKLLQELAAEIGAELGLAVEGEVEVREREPERFEIPDSLEPPRRTDLVLERNPVGLILRAPATGMRGTAARLFAMAIFWITITAIITFGFASSDETTTATMWFMVPFWIIGPGIMLVAIHVAKRHEVLAVVNGDLLVKTTGLFGSRSRELRGADIGVIDVRPSRYTVNNRVLPALHVEGGGEEVQLLVGQSEREIAWVVAVLRDAL